MKHGLQLPSFISIILWFIIGINILFSAGFVLRGDLLFHSDIGRDFLLMDEVSNKKIVLIGPRASGPPGLYHGPLWVYFNFPAYFFSGGNPVVVGWYWVVVSAIFLGATYVLLKKLLNPFTALFSTLFISFTTAEIANKMFNPHGAFFMVPFILYFLTRYHQKEKWHYLLGLLLFVGFAIQFQFAVGIPLLILVSLMVGYRIIRNKNFSHLLSFAVLLLPFSTWIVFNIRHDFIQIRAIMYYLTQFRTAESVSFMTMITERLQAMVSTALQIVPSSYNWINLLVVVIIMYTAYHIKKNIHGKTRFIFFTLLYLYGGFWFLSLVHQGSVMDHYFMPFLPVTVLLFVLSVTILKNKFVYLLAAFVVIINIVTTVERFRMFQTFIGRDLSTWKVQYSIADRVFSDNEKEFGYFIYTPDQLSYSTKYAMLYGQKKHSSQIAYSYEKKPVTYLIIAPPPKEYPHMTGDWWKQNQVKIANKPAMVMELQNGYRIEKVLLTPEDIKIQTDGTLNTGIELR